LITLKTHIALADPPCSSVYCLVNFVGTTCSCGNRYAIWAGPCYSHINGQYCYTIITYTWIGNC
jgi:hypothetical protein